MRRLLRSALARDTLVWGKSGPVVAEVVEERRRQTARWGVQTLEDGTGSPEAAAHAESLRALCDGARSTTWSVVLLEEVAEALAEPSGSANLRAELVQIAAVAVQWVEAIDRRSA